MRARTPARSFLRPFFFFFLPSFHMLRGRREVSGVCAAARILFDASGSARLCAMSRYPFFFVHVLVTPISRIVCNAKMAPDATPCRPRQRHVACLMA